MLVSLSAGVRTFGDNNKMADEVPNRETKGSK